MSSFAKIAVLGTAFYITTAFQNSAYADDGLKPMLFKAMPARLSSQEERLQKALQSLEDLKDLNAALEKRVKELEEELAACKDQKGLPKEPSRE